MHGIIYITLGEPDYKSVVEQQVRHYAQTVRTKGFRVGAVPLELVRKTYGPTILAKELGTIASKALQDYLKKEKIPIFMEPLLITSEEAVDFVHQRLFTFAYEVALIGLDEVKLGPYISVTEFEIDQIGTQLVDEFLEGLQLVHGQVTSLEESDHQAILYGTLEDKMHKIRLKTRIAVARVAEHLRNPLIGLRLGSKVLLPKELFTDRFSAFLGLSFEQLAAFSRQPEAWPASFTVDTIAHVRPALLEQAFFDLILGNGIVDSEITFREAIAKIILFDKRTEMRHAFYEALQAELFKYNPIELPKDFLERWLLVHNPNATLEEISYYYTAHENHLKWELLLGGILRNNDLAIGHPEILDEATRIYTDYAKKRLGDTELDDSVLQSGMLSFLQEDQGKQYAQLHAKLSREKAIDFIRERISIVRQPITAEHFDTLRCASM